MLVWEAQRRRLKKNKVSNESTTSVAQSRHAEREGLGQSWKAVTPEERAADPLVDDLVRDKALEILDDVT